MKSRYEPGDLIQLSGPYDHRTLTVYDVKLRPYGDSYRLYKNHVYVFDSKTSSHMSLWEFELYELLKINSSKIYKVVT
jgi:hypothetical protein